MPELELFRKRQKLIFWIVAAFVIPSFVLVWGVSRGPGGGYSNAAVMAVNGKDVRRSDYELFRRRLRAATDGRFDQNQTSVQFAYVYAQLAQAAGITISPVEESNYLHKSHGRLAEAAKVSEEEFRKAFREDCVRNEISAEEYRQGVRELLAIGRLIHLDNMTGAPTRETVYTAYAYGRAEAVVKRLRYPATDELRAEVRARFDALAPEEKNAEIARIAAAHANDERFREPARFRFEYLLAPYGAFQKDSLTDEEVRRYYDDHASRYLGRSFEEAKADAKDDAFHAARRRFAESLIRAEVDSVLARYLAQDGGMPSLDVLAGQRELSRAEIRTGDSGPEAETIAELEKIDAFKPDADAAAEGVPSVATELLAFDRLPEPLRTSRLEKWKKDFSFGVAPAGALGRLRLRLLDYVPSQPMGRNADGSWPETLAQAAGEEWTRETVDAELRQQAEAAVNKIREGDLSDLEAVEAVTMKYTAPDFPTPLVGLKIGDVTEPMTFQESDGLTGMAVLALVDRRLPNREDWESQDEFTKRFIESQMSRYFMGGLMETQARTIVINPSQFYSGWMDAEMSNGRMWLPAPDRQDYGGDY